MSKVTPAKYGIASLFGGTYWLTKLGEQVTARVAPDGTTEWLWNWVSYPALFVIAGFLISDFLNPKSDIRQAIRKRREIFEVKFHPSSYMIEGIGHYNRPRFALRALKFAKSVTVSVVVYEHFQFRINNHAKPIIVKTPKDYNADDTLSLTIATIPRKDVQSSHGFWGEQLKWDHGPDAVNHTPIHGSDNIVELRVTQGKKVLQTYRLFFGVGERIETDGKYFYLEETRDAFS